MGNSSFPERREVIGLDRQSGVVERVATDDIDSDELLTGEDLTSFYRGPMETIMRNRKYFCEQLGIDDYYDGVREVANIEDVPMKVEYTEMQRKYVYAINASNDLQRRFIRLVNRPDIEKRRGELDRMRGDAYDLVYGGSDTDRGRYETNRSINEVVKVTSPKLHVIRGGRAE